MSDWRPTATPEALRQRARLLGQVRGFFAERGVTEVHTPLLTASGVTDVHIESLPTTVPRGWLRTSPEYCHKRLLAAGFGDLYELGPVFRRGEAGRNHQPEFTLLEWYRVGWGWRELADEVVELLRRCLQAAEGEWPVRHLAWNECFRQFLEIDALTASSETLAGLADDAPGGLDRDGLLDWLFATRIQPRFDARAITVVHDYPASQAALARLDPDDTRVAQRFEVFAGSTELANGYHELCEAREQRARFDRDNRIRRESGRSEMPIDERLLAALESGLPDCSGVALGFDRLVMTVVGAGAIEEVVSFAHPRSP